MFNIPQQVKIFVSLEPTDMRRGFNGLSGEVTINGFELHWSGSSETLLRHPRLPLHFITLLAPVAAYPDKYETDTRTG